MRLKPCTLSLEYKEFRLSYADRLFKILSDGNLQSESPNYGVEMWYRSALV